MSAAAVIFMLIVTSYWLIAPAKAWLRQGVAGCWTTIPGGRRKGCRHTLTDGQGSIALFSARTSKPSALMSISCPSPAHLALSSLPILHEAGITLTLGWILQISVRPATCFLLWDGSRFFSVQRPTLVQVHSSTSTQTPKADKHSPFCPPRWRLPGHAP